MPFSQMNDLDRIGQSSAKKLLTYQNVNGSATKLNMGMMTTPFLEQVPFPDKEELLIKKLAQCCQMFNFLEPNSDLKEKNAKSELLQEVASFFAKAPIELSDCVYQQVLITISTNIVRVLPPFEVQTFDPEEEPVFEASWPHLKLVYELFSKFLDCPQLQLNSARRVISEEFVSRLIDLFDSGDFREREELKIILHKIYSKFISLRFFIRKKINSIFIIFVYETERFNGISELLEIFSSIINGFKTPLKQEHRNFLVKVLLPLLKPKCLELYLSHLTNCILLMLTKDVRLIEPTISSFLKFWPKTCSGKELVFLDLTEKVLDSVENNELVNMQIQLFKRLSKCITSNHYMVAERALLLLNSGTVMNMIQTNHDILLPLIVPSVHLSSREHWHEMVVYSASNTLKNLKKINWNMVKQLLSVE